MDNTEDDARRILIRANVKTIPGVPNARPWTLWEIFCSTHLHRAAKLDASPRSESGSVDVVHVLPGFDSANDTKAWFLNDVGVKNDERSSSIDILSLPHDIFLAHFDEQNGQWYVCVTLHLLSCLHADETERTFVQRPMSDGYRKYCKRWAWGGTQAGRNREKVVSNLTEE